MWFKTIFSSNLWCALSPTRFSLNPTFLEKMISSSSLSKKHIELLHLWRCCVKTEL